MFSIVKEFKKIFICLLVCFFVVDFAYAGSFLGLEPGVSGKSDVYNQLGTPINISESGKRMDYDGTKYDAKTIVVRFYNETDKIRSIEIKLDFPYDYDEIKNILELKYPFEVKSSDKNYYVEYYLPQSVSLHVKDSEENKGVQMLTYFDLALYENDEAYPRQRPYFGVGLKSKIRVGFEVEEVEKGSPADVAGFVSGDIILEINQNNFRETKQDASRFMYVMSALPLYENAEFIVLRNGQELKLIAKILPMSNKLVKDNEKKAFILFQKGQILISKKDPYGAKDMFKNAIWLYPREPLFYAALADAYFRIGLIDFAIDEVKKSIAMQPLPFSYYILGLIYFSEEKYDEAFPVLLKARALDYYNADVYSKIGYCYFSKGQYDAAVEQYSKAYELDRQNFLSVYYLARCYDKMHNNILAIEKYELFLKFNLSDEASIKKAAEERLAFLQGKLSPKITPKK